MHSLEFGSRNIQSRNKGRSYVCIITTNRKKRKSYEGFMKKVKLFKTMDEYEMTKVLDALKPITFKAGDQIIKEVLGGSIIG